MRKIFLIIALVLICAGVGFASGSEELASTQTQQIELFDDDDSRFITLTFEDKDYPFFEVRSEDFNIQYALLEIDGYIYDLAKSGWQPLKDGYLQKAKKILEYDNILNELNLVDNNENLYISDVKGLSKTIEASDLYYIDTLINETNYYFGKVTSNTIPMIKSYYPTNSKLILIRNDNEAKYFEFNMEDAGFFPKESYYISLLGENARQMNYTNKALALMYLSLKSKVLNGTLPEDDISTLFINTLIKHKNLFSDMDLDTDFIEGASIGVEDISSLFDNLQKGFYYTLGHIKINKQPVMITNNHTWDKFYNEKTRSPYLFAYLLLLYEIDKPVLSSIVENNQLNWKTADKIENNADLVASAMQFYTQCFEYTPAVPDEGVAIENLSMTMNRVFEKVITNKDTGTISLKYSDYLSKKYPDDSNLRITNYFPLVTGSKNRIRFSDFNNIEFKYLDFKYPSVFASDSAFLFGYPLDEIEKMFKIELTLSYSSKAKYPLYPSKFDDVWGNPIAYSPFGIDSPRTFNRKLYEQWMSQIPYKRMLTTSVFPYSEYITDECDPNKDIRPFVPGKIFSSSKGYKEITDLSNYAGVDSLGLVLGAISISGMNFYSTNFTQPVANGVLASLNNSDKLNSYYSFSYQNSEQTEPIKFNYDEEQFNQLRINLADLENQTVIVPDISLIQPGDFLIDTTGNTNDPHIGIVIDTGSSGRYDVKVLSVRRGLQIAMIGRWGNNVNMFNGFTMNPDKYIIRRLINYTQDEVVDSNTLNTNWDLVDKPPTDLSIKIDFQNDSMPNWIPNTELADGIFEPVVFETIKITDGGKPLPLGTPVKISGPQDMYYDQNSNINTQGNIYNNAGTGIELIAIDESESEYDKKYISLATFVKNDNGITYNPTYNEEYFWEDGSPKFRTSLATRGKILTFQFKNHENKIKSLTTFGVRVLNGTIRPGDDFLLHFEVKGYSDPVIDPDTNQLVIANNGYVSNGDFIAVYDKKMLWRANLYVDETRSTNGTASNNLDWNNQNPWIYDNDRNKINTGIGVQGSIVANSLNLQNFIISPDNLEDPDDANSLIFTSNNVVPGGQVKKITPWTSRNIVEPVYNTIAYSFASSDSINQFNLEMFNQSKVLSHFFDENEVTPASNEVDPYNSSLAPGGVWSNYINEDEALVAFSIGPTDIPYYTLNGNNYYPYIPTLNEGPDFNGTPDGEENSSMRHASGIECANFIRRAASYQGTEEGDNSVNNYTTDDMTLDDSWDSRAAWDQRGPINRYSILRHEVDYSTAPGPNINAVVDNTTYLDGEMILEIPLIPGDIIVMNGHKVIINSLTFLNGERSFQISNIGFIEAASGFGDEYRVLNTQNFWGYISTYPNFFTWYNFSRLRME